MAQNMPAIVAHHRAIVERAQDSPGRAPLESVQIVLLAEILEAAQIKKSPAKAKKR